jgi:hypothetical protein
MIDDLLGVLSCLQLRLSGPDKQISMFMCIIRQVVLGVS